MKKEKEKLLEVGNCDLKENYVPRHQRVSLGVKPYQKEEISFHEVDKEIPIIGENGSLVETKIVHELVPASDALSPYKYEDFRLENLIAAGVPLSEVSVVKEMPISSGSVIDTARRLSFLTQDAIFAEQINENVVGNNSDESLKPNQNE